MQKIQALEDATSNGIITFTDRNFEYEINTISHHIFRDLVMKNPRPYDVVVMYTVDKSCELCEYVLHYLT